MIPSRDTLLRSLLLLAAFLLLATERLAGQETGASISIQLDRGEIAVGERAEITLKIRTADLEATHLLLPREIFPEEGGGTSLLEILHYQITDTVAVGNGVSEITGRLIFTAFEQTLLTIPPFGVELGGRENYSDALHIKVTAPEVDLEHPEKFHPIRENWHLRYSFREVMALIAPWLVGILLLVALYFLFRYGRQWLRRPRPATPTPSQPILTPYERLTQALEELNATDPSRHYYTQLDLILREYLSATCLPAALEMTSSQLKQRLGAEHFPCRSDEKEALRYMLERFALAKFARQEYDPQQKVDDRQRVRAIAERIEADSAPQPSPSEKETER